MNALQAPGPGGAPGGVPDEKERMWGMLAHISPIIVGFLGPLIIMLMPDSLVGRPSPFLKHHAKQSLIWTIALIVVAILTCGIGGLVMMIWQVLAGLAANKGEWYVYPGLSSFVDKR
jgi:uncharacterized protein